MLDRDDHKDLATLCRLHCLYLDGATQTSEYQALYAEALATRQTTHPECSDEYNRFWIDAEIVEFD